MPARSTPLSSIPRPAPRWSAMRPVSVTRYALSLDHLAPLLKTEAGKTGPVKGLVNGIDKMRPEYYKAHDWTLEDAPESSMLERLGL
ncbi:MAG: aldehyde ferredoxin oxidoreductase C-terminal domain-containing protein [Candidatus Dechloromonas phosphoritropha]|nr:hypothetical protein [Candidatus Dechloromonas phosphoritropha]MBP8789005.1 hypothetical protein [Azonexus sp.]MBP9227335.1 hypothetical protein [Azonexus sp.]